MISNRQELVVPFGGNGHERIGVATPGRQVRKMKYPIASRPPVSLTPVKSLPVLIPSDIRMKSTAGPGPPGPVRAAAVEAVISPRDRFVNTSPASRRPFLLEGHRVRAGNTERADEPERAAVDIVLAVDIAHVGE